MLLQMTRDKILAALPALPQGDLQAIRAVIDTLLPAGAVAGSLKGNELGYNPGAWLIAAMGATLGTPIALQGEALKAFNKNIPTALAFIEQHFKAALNNKTTALALMRYLLRLLVLDMQGMKVPVTKNTMAQNIHRLGEVFTNAFPGYAEGQVSALILMAILGKADH